ncbi:uncharacterized protein LOC107269581 [Cephus cinctus]|uniref:E3 ubiquitin-protein ligase E3D n=1 Tax=Cephus cinctus TaxID=211228 RepID=A0AAJ7FMH2_CEPCN|nr:uncharacterized protein LOC107269581 [Cephus cinctus]XP_015599091.1 uncharacterized protein LOC107269581 [Cephus cinctus]
MVSVTLELRPRLRSCNVFIYMHGAAEPESIRLKLNEDAIIFGIGEKTTTLSSSSIKIVPKSLSLLRVTSNWISFRVQTKPINSSYGSFGTEILGAELVEIDTVLRDLKGNTILPTENSEFRLSCVNCKNDIIKTVSFKRVLPLPRTDCDPSEWFCCKHDENNESSTLLSPRKSDYFYGAYYCVLHKNNLCDHVKIDKKVVVCGKCLSIIGMPWDNVSVKIWNCCIEYKTSKNPLPMKISTALDDFLLVILDSVDTVPGSRLLLEATEGNHTHYLLLQPMDWHLDLLVEPEILPNNKNLVNLRRIRVIKVLYKYGEKKADIISNSSEFQQCHVALPIMLAGVEQLLLSTKRVPPSYRVADEYYIGYVYVQKVTENGVLPKKQ